MTSFREKYGGVRDFSLLQNINGKIMRLNPPKNELCTCCRTIYDASRSIVSERALTLNGYQDLFPQSKKNPYYKIFTNTVRLGYFSILPLFFLSRNQLGTLPEVNQYLLCKSIKAALCASVSNSGILLKIWHFLFLTFRNSQNSYVFSKTRQFQAIMSW